MISIKKLDNDTRVYRRFDKDSNCYIIEDWMCNEFEMNYFETQEELKQWVSITMDIGAEIMVISAKEILDCPITKWYFYY